MTEHVVSTFDIFLFLFLYTKFIWLLVISWKLGRNFLLSNCLRSFVRLLIFYCQNKNEKEIHDVTIIGTRCKIKASEGLSLITLSIFWKASNNGRQCGVKRLGTVDDYFRMWSRLSRKSVTLYTTTFPKSLSLNSVDNDQNTLEFYSERSFVHFVCFFLL